MKPGRLRYIAFSLVALMMTAELLAPPDARAGETATDIEPLKFLVGKWASETGRDRDGRTLRGGFVIELVAGGAGMLRRDHTDMLDGAGRIVQSLDQVMLIYPEGGHIRADYFDGSHAIHYTDAIVDLGRSVKFVTGPGAPGPTFSLTYGMPTDSKLTTKFEMMAPGQGEMHVVAEGESIRY